MKVVIEKLDYEGRGLTHIDGKVIFVPRALPQEEVDISLQEEKKNYSLAKINTIYTKSEKRIPSFCPYAKECGGCTFDLVRYEDSLKYKKEILKDLFSKSKIEIPMFQMVPSRPVLEYRNKVSLHVKDFQFGYYKENSHDFVPIRKCVLCSSTITSVLEDFSYFSFSNGKLMIRVNDKEECVLSIETNEKIKIKEELIAKHKIVGILLNGKTVYGKDNLEFERDGIIYKVPANSFFQVNPYISECIVKEIINHISKEEILFDLYCGVGFFSLRLSKYAKKIIGIESNLNAILAAHENARKNKISNVSFHVGKVEEVLKKIPHTSKKVIVDPPRSGLHNLVIKTFLEEEIETIFYISCNPITLVRDLKQLQEKYQVKYFYCYDMFCFTKHMECLCILNRKF